MRVTRPHRWLNGAVSSKDATALRGRPRGLPDFHIFGIVCRCVLLDMSAIVLGMDCQQEDLVGPVQCCLHSDLEADDGRQCVCVYVNM